MITLKKLKQQLTKSDVAEIYFFNKDFIHLKTNNEILTGFCFERISHGIYIVKYIQPLYVPSENVNLTYSDRYKYLNHNLKDSEILNEAMQVILDKQLISNLEDLSKPSSFYKHFNKENLTYEQSEDVVLTAVYLNLENADKLLQKLIEETEKYLSEGSDYLEKKLDFYNRLLVSSQSERQIIFQDVITNSSKHFGIEGADEYVKW